MPRVIAFLRAINVGGRTVKMDRLRGLFADAGFRNVETFIASANVIFDSPGKTTAGIERKIEAGLRVSPSDAFLIIVAHEPQRPRTTVTVNDLSFEASRVIDVQTGQTILDRRVDGVTPPRAIRCALWCLHGSHCGRPLPPAA